MVTKTGGGLVKTSFVLPERHLDRLREIAAERSTDWRRVSMADVHREVVERGLQVVLHAPDTGFDASGPTDAVAAAQAAVAGAEVELTRIADRADANGRAA